MTLVIGKDTPPVDSFVMRQRCLSINCNAVSLFSCDDEEKASVADNGCLRLERGDGERGRERAHLCQIE